MLVISEFGFQFFGDLGLFDFCKALELFFLFLDFFDDFGEAFRFLKFIQNMEQGLGNFEIVFVCISGTEELPEFLHPFLREYAQAAILEFNKFLIAVQGFFDVPEFYLLVSKSHIGLNFKPILCRTKLQRNYGRERVVFFDLDVFQPKNPNLMGF